MFGPGIRLKLWSFLYALTGTEALCVVNALPQLLWVLQSLLVSWDDFGNSCLEYSFDSVYFNSGKGSVRAHRNLQSDP